MTTVDEWISYLTANPEEEGDKVIHGRLVDYAIYGRSVNGAIYVAVCQNKVNVFEKLICTIAGM